MIVLDCNFQIRFSPYSTVGKVVQIYEAEKKIRQPAIAKVFFHLRYFLVVFLHSPSARFFSLFVFGGGTSQHFYIKSFLSPSWALFIVFLRA